MATPSNIKDNVSAIKPADSNIKDNVSAIKPADESESGQIESSVEKAEAAEATEAAVAAEAAEAAVAAEAAEAAPAALPADAVEPTPEFDLDSPEFYLNRELTWLEFNRRVLHEGFDESNPLLERLKFVGIVSANLDEFFMKRIGGTANRGMLRQGSRTGSAEGCIGTAIDRAAFAK